jgi:hypothetical protein
MTDFLAIKGCNQREMFGVSDPRLAMRNHRETTSVGNPVRRASFQDKRRFEVGYIFMRFMKMGLGGGRNR